MGRTNFPEKNEARRRAKAKSRGNYRRARRARKEHGTNGAFGNLGKDSPAWELCAYGTVSQRDREDDE